MYYYSITFPTYFVFRKFWLYLFDEVTPMKKLVVAIALIFAGSILFADDSANLADMAKKEKERRAKAKPTKTLTNDDVDQYKAKHADESQTAPASDQNAAATDEQA